MIELGDIEVTVITPTIGKSSLGRLIESLESQSVPYVQILLWDDKKAPNFIRPLQNTQNGVRYSIDIPGSFVKGDAFGSSLRSVGLMAANTPFVVFADDDVWFENNHLESMLDALKKNNAKWGFSVRKVWTNLGECIGEDRFESVGDSPSRIVPYEMVDNNVMMFHRKFGASAACLYRETENYNDDRLMYAFLKKYAGEPARTGKATVNQVCPERLEKMFRRYCING
jgi:glycosyltransferase involved in cell wall biosynthesis